MQGEILPSFHPVKVTIRSAYQRGKLGENYKQHAAKFKDLKSKLWENLDARYDDVDVTGRFCEGLF